jgi:tetratricopeptide (TPR) repeat protein
MIRYGGIEILERKSLGLGFEDLLSDAVAGINVLKNDCLEEKIKSFYNSAIVSEDTKKVIDAIFNYKSIIDLFEKNVLPFENGNNYRKNNDIFEIVMKSMNNLGAICYDLNLFEEAQIWFERILTIDANNEMAKENLQILKSEKK